MKKAVTRRDVAKMAGVSEAPVSYVMNRTKKLSPEVEKRIWNAIETLDYHPNLLARSLATKKTMHIAMLVDNIQNPHFSRIMTGVQEIAECKGYIVSLLSTNYSKKETLIELVSRGVDGIISTLDTHSIKDFSNLNIPIVYGTYDRDYYKKAIFDAIKAFKEFGHHRIAFLSGLPLAQNHPRYCNFIDALNYYDMKVYPELFIDGDGSTNENAGYIATDKLLSSGEPFSAIFALNDLMAMGAMKRLNEEGLKIPEDISIVGCDGITSSMYIIPALSTINSHAYTLGKNLMYRLLNKMQPQCNYPLPPTLQAEFIQRNSLGECPTRLSSNTKTS